VYRRGTIWCIDYRDQLGKRHREAVDTHKRVAEQALAKRKTEVAENRFLDKKKQSRIKFADFASEFIETYSKPNKRSWKRDMQLVSHLTLFFNNSLLHQIGPQGIEKYKKERTKHVKPATVNRELSCLRTIFNKAIEWGKVEQNPVKKIKFYKENNKRVRYLEPDEVHRLVQECPDHLTPIVTVAIHTGMRLGEILNLKWQDIDLKRRLIYIVDSKSKEGRELPMNFVVSNTLSQCQEAAHGDYVFSHPDGSPYRKIYRGFKTACRKAGIKDFRFHDLRHTFASYLVMNGQDLKTVQELLGHKSFEMTLRYAHLSPDHKRKAVDDLGSRMQKVVTIWSQRNNS